MSESNLTVSTAPGFVKPGDVDSLSGYASMMASVQPSKHLWYVLVDIADTLSQGGTVTVLHNESTKSREARYGK